MTDREFTVWASERGVPIATTEAILRHAASPEEMQEAYDAMEPAPPVYTLAEIVEMADKDPYGISARANGFIVVGECPNGDPIAISLAYELGTVWYICHETMHSEPLREVAVLVAKDLTEMLEGIADVNFPFDYFEARNRE